MSLTGSLLIFAAVWGAIHALSYIVKKRQSSVLPSNSRSRISSRTFWDTTITIKYLHLRVDTKAWNTQHDVLAASLSGSKQPLLRKLLLAFYNLGTAIGMLGMLGAVGLLLWTCEESARMLYLTWSTHNSHPNPTSELSQFRKRDLSTPSGIPYSSPRPLITPIIPGVTVPFSHLPLLVVAVFSSQVLHELGHALAAALESLPALSVGFSFTFCIPAAYVAFSTSTLQSLRRDAQSRIIAAGPFHNIAFWIIITSAAWLQLDRICYTLAGYKDISSIGKVVVDLVPESALYYHVSPGSIITKLDDTFLASSDIYADPWTTYLSRPSNAGQGWCIAMDLLVSQACCTSVENIEDVSCFKLLDSGTMKGCLDPVPILTNPGYARCSGSSNCSENSVCLHPDEKAQLLRLSVRLHWTHEEEDAILLWKGPKDEILEQVEVGSWVPRIGILPLRLPHYVHLFWGYLKIANLSLFLLNLLPLPRLDGVKLLGVMLDIGSDDEEISDAYSLGETEGRGKLRGKSGMSRERLKKYIPMGTMYICVMLVILEIMIILR